MKTDYKSEGYLRWLLSLIDFRDSKYDNLLYFLFSTPFYFNNSYDMNRALDGLELRYNYYGKEFDSNCSVLEVMVALSCRCMNEIVGDHEYIDASYIFNHMIRSLGLENQTNSNFNPVKCNSVIDIFFKGQYEPNGKGGLFYIEGCNEDLRSKEIWYQMLFYLDYILDI